MSAVFSAIREAACTQRSAADGQVVGLFRVRRKVAVGQAVKEIMDAVLGDATVINVADGVTIERPESIQLQVVNGRRLEFSPNLPVRAEVMSISMSVDVSVIELVRDEESGNPAILITTASSLKPDVVIVCEVGETPKPKPSGPSEVLDTTKLESVIKSVGLPERHIDSVRHAVVAAYGPRRIAQMQIAKLPSRGIGGISREDAEHAARQIVQSLVDEKVVSFGVFFWLRLGYWLVKIFAALIQANSRGDE